MPYDEDAVAEALRQMAEDARADDALTPDDINPPPYEPSALPFGIQTPARHRYMAWRARQKKLGRNQ